MSIVLRFLILQRFDTTYVSSMAPRVPEDDTDPGGLSDASAGLTAEQDELRLHGLRILARIIARRLLSDPSSFDAGSEPNHASSTNWDSTTEGKESIG